MPYSNDTVVLAPPADAMPFTVALPVPTAAAAVVVTDGAVAVDAQAAVVNDWFAPVAVPALLAAFARKLYAVPQVSPASGAVAAVAALPAAALEGAAATLVP
jgi:hypothetical protein